MAVLVTAASRHGATQEIAAFIADRLRSSGLDVTREQPQHVEDLLPFSTVVLGSAVYAGRWLAEAKHFADRFARQLSTRDVWLFSSGPVGEPRHDPPSPRLPRGLVPRSHEVFAGRLDRSRLGRVERLMARAVGASEGDFRDWAAIAGWTDRIAADARRPRPATAEPQKGTSTSD